MNFCSLKNNLTIDFTRKSTWNCISTAVMMLYLVKRSEKSNVSSVQLVLKFLNFICHLLAVRPGCARCRACQENNFPPENFYPRIKFFSNCVKKICSTLKIFVRLARPCLTAFSSAFSVLLAACECFFLLL